MLTRKSPPYSWATTGVDLPPPGTVHRILPSAGSTQCVSRAELQITRVPRFVVQRAGDDSWPVTRGCVQSTSPVSAFNPVNPSASTNAALPTTAIDDATRRPGGRDSLPSQSTLPLSPPRQ